MSTCLEGWWVEIPGRRPSPVFILSGVSQARLVHTILGWLLPCAAPAVAVVAGVGHARRTRPPRLAIAVYPLPVLLWIQEVLGHLPFPATTAIHVPLGVSLTVYPAVLAVLVSRSRPPGPRHG